MKYWVWTSTDQSASTDVLRTKYRSLKENRINGVFLGGGIDDREFEIIREAGLELHSWMITTNCRDDEVRKKHPEWFMVSRSGKSSLDHPPYVPYYQWISPLLPEVRKYINERAERLAEHHLIQGVHLDYVRYPDVILPIGLWEQYGLDQTEEMAEYDFDYSDRARELAIQIIGKDPALLENPSADAPWLHLRYNSVTTLVKELSATVHAKGKLITAAVFPTPSMARRICRQDWDKWPLDLFCPMIYHSFYNKTIDWIGEAMIENIGATTTPICAGLYMPAFRTPQEFKIGLELVKKRGGSGISLFDDVSEEYWQAFREVVG